MSNLSNLRRIINEDELKSLLIKYNFKFLKLSDFKIQDQIKIFYSAKTIIGNHGAGFTNILFCKRNANIVEFVNPHTSNLTRNICSHLNLNYFKMNCKVVGKNTKDQNNNIRINIKKLDKILKKLK